MTFSLQGRPGVNGYKGEKGEPGVGSGFGFPVSVNFITSSLNSSFNGGRSYCP